MEEDITNIVQVDIQCTHLSLMAYYPYGVSPMSEYKNVLGAPGVSLLTWNRLQTYRTLTL